MVTLQPGACLSEKRSDKHNRRSKHWWHWDNWDAGVPRYPNPPWVPYPTLQSHRSQRSPGALHPSTPTVGRKATYWDERWGGDGSCSSTFNTFPLPDPRAVSDHLHASVSPMLGSAEPSWAPASPAGSRSAPAWRRISPGWQNPFP